MKYYLVTGRLSSVHQPFNKNISYAVVPYPSGSTTLQNKKLCRAFCRETNGLTLNTPVFQGLLRVNRKAEKKMRKVDKLKIMN